MSLIAQLVRDAFHWLEYEGFLYVGEENRLPSYAISTFERGPITVVVHWDGRDHATWTEVGRGHRRLRWLPGRQLGLSHLREAGGPTAIVLPDPSTDPEPLRTALERDSKLLRTQAPRSSKATARRGPIWRVFRRCISGSRLGETGSGP